MTTTTAAIEVEPLAPKQRRQQERRRLKLASLNEQLAWFASPDRKGEGFLPHDLRKDVKRIQKRILRLQQITPSGAWYSDARGIRLDRGGEFPPTDDQGVPLMVRAIGEKRLYPATYITSSGHSWCAYLIAIHTGTTPALTEDGYRGGRVAIYDLNRRERAQIHRAEADSQSTAHETRHGERFITNVF